jgi:hypothetical protein
MTIDDITRIRLANQQISFRKFNSVKELVGYMGAFQAQDYPMAKWAIGLRLQEASESLINDAINKGVVLRTHLLRPTWHFVSSDDIYWMLELTAPRIKSSMNSRNKQLELTNAVFKMSNNIIRNALAGNNHLTREELIEILNKANIKTDENRASHLLAEAELSGIICSGILKGNKQTYALLEERISNKKYLSEEEALKNLAKKYFMSRGPATLKDFTWWSGQSVTQARKALDMILPEMKSFELNTLTYWFFNSSSEYENQKDYVFLLPTYDEFIISYSDRSAVLTSEAHKNIISTYGIFRAIIVYNGKVIGTWNRKIKKDQVIIEMNCFKKQGNKIQTLIEKEAERFSEFFGKDKRQIKH